MRLVALALCLAISASAFAADESLTEDDFRGTLGLAHSVAMSYRDQDCRPVSFEQYVVAMHLPGAHSDVDRAADGTAVTLSIKMPGSACPSPYPPISTLPPFDLRDLAGKRVTSASLKGKPTLINFYFATCVPCILEVGPLNGFAADRRDLNVLAVTFDEPAVAREFVARYKFKWRVVADARDLIDRIRVKQYPMMALFDAEGRLLGTRRGGVRDELEAVTVAPQLKRWVDGLLRTSHPTTAKP